jgi:hypothetical protein
VLHAFYQERRAARDQKTTVPPPFAGRYRHEVFFVTPYFAYKKQVPLM